MFHVPELTKKSIVESLPWQDISKNPFIDTDWAPYLGLHPKHKGGIGELYVDGILTELGHDVKPRSSEGHDRIIDGWKTEIKFSLASKGETDKFTWNHLACEKDYERAILVGINCFEEDRWKWFCREDFRQNWQEGFSRQQGGQKSENDDYCLLGKANSLFNLNWIHDMETWND